MSSTSIYTSDFTPTYLYIKQHSVTGKLYFGKTTKDPEKYLGSGKHWIKHINKHGKEYIDTLWFCLFYDMEECTNFALMFSEQENIVKSNNWLNLIAENGLSGTPAGTKITELQRQRLSSISKERHKNPTQQMLDGRIRAGKTLVGRRLINHSGILHWAYGIKGEKHPNFGKIHTKEQNLQHSNNIKGENYPMFGKFGIDHSVFGKSWSWSEESKMKNSGSNSSRYGKSLSDECKQKISNATKGAKNGNYGKSLTKEQKENLSNKRSNRTTAYDLENNIFVCISKELFDSLKGIRYVGTSSKLIPK